MAELLLIFKYAARRNAVGEYQIDLSVGDVLHVGDCTIKVLDVDGPVASFQIERGDELESVLWGAPLSASTHHDVLD